MKDDEIGIEGASQAWMNWPTDLGQTAIAVIAKTRGEWLPRGSLSPLSKNDQDNGTGCGHSVLRLVPDAISDGPEGPRGTRVRLRRGVA